MEKARVLPISVAPGGEAGLKDRLEMGRARFQRMVLGSGARRAVIWFPV